MKIRLLIFFLLLSFSCFSQSLQLKKTIDKAYNYEKNEDYLTAKKEFALFLKEKNNSDSDINFAKNHLFLYDYLLSDNSKILLVDEGIKSILKVKNRKPYETELLLKLFTEKYNYEADNNLCENAIITAEKGYKLLDFEQATTETKILYLLNLGKTYRNCHNPYKAILFIKKSIVLNISYKGENNFDLANTYNLLGDTYIENYNPVKGNECYKKAISILEKTYANKPENTDLLLEGYRNLIRNLLEYGAQNDAKIYVNKINTLFNKQKQRIKSFSNKLYVHSRQMQVHSNVIFNAATRNFAIATSFCDSLKLETQFNKENIDAIKFVLTRYYDVADYLYEAEEYKLTIKKAHDLEPIINNFHHLLFALVDRFLSKLFFFQLVETLSRKLY